MVLFELLSGMGYQAMDRPKKERPLSPRERVGVRGFERLTL